MLKRSIIFLGAVLMLCSSVCAFSSEEAVLNSGAKINLNVKDASLTNVIYTLGNDAGLNIIAGSAIKGRVTLSLNNVSPFDALKSVLKAGGYTYKIEGNIIRIESAPGIKIGGDEISREKGMLTNAFLLNNISVEEVLDLLTKLNLKNTKVLGTKSNVIVVEAPSYVMQRVDKIIKKLDTTPNQVIVESQIMEVTAGNGATPNSLGVKVKYTGTNVSAQTEGFANPAATGVSGFYAHVVKGNADAYLQALERKEGYNLLANPKVIAVSGKPANIISGSKLGYKTTLTTTTGTSQNVDFLEVGTKLSFTPYISSDGTIRMDIHPEVSEGNVTTDGLPQKQTTEATTTVIVRDGETVIIGGLIKNKSSEAYNGVPVIMNIPLIGNFFKKKEIVYEKKEIICMLTPHIITNEILKKMGTEIDSMKEKQKDTGTDPGIMWWVK